MGYTLRETRFSIGEDFLVETESGERAFKVNGKARRARAREGRDRVGAARAGDTWWP
jgi:uncharacterized protein YxjI